jgi:hypothetical protein
MCAGFVRTELETSGVPLLLILGAVAFRHWLDRWAPLADWLVAAGTILLALATFMLARRARDEAKAVREDADQVAEQVRLQREQMERGSRAYVYPHVPWDWARGELFWAGGPKMNLTALPLKNGGPGLARNVHGKARWPLGEEDFYETTLYGSSIAPGDEIQTRLSQDALAWGGSGGSGGAEGYVLYTDLAEQEWVTRFVFRSEEGQLVGEHEAPVLVSDLDEDESLYPRHTSS